MNRFILFGYLGFSVLGLIPSSFAADFRAPELTGPVVDDVGMLSRSESQTLESALRVMNSQGKAQMNVLIAKSLQGLEVEQYSMKVAEAWKLGKADTDRGLILVIAPNERTMRLEVGYGLEGDIPDVIAKRILDDTVRPYFKERLYFEGIQAAVLSISERLQIPMEASGLKREERPASRSRGAAGLAGYAFIAFFLMIRLSAAGAFTGVLGGVVGYFVFRFIGLGGLGFGIGALIGFLLSFRFISPTSLLTSRGMNRGWGSGGFGGSGGGSGGSWGGGGGGFGGGGASSSW